jgi:hypothetical protein
MIIRKLDFNFRFKAVGMEKLTTVGIVNFFIFDNLVFSKADVVSPFPWLI